MTLPSLTDYDAFLFDLDGVITPTVDLHMRAWAETFDAYFAAHGLAPYREDEYYDSLDGRPRFAGVAALLATRGISLPPGDPVADGIGGTTAAMRDGAETTDSTAPDTIATIGNRKNQRFDELLRRDGIDAYAGSLVLLDMLAATNQPLAVVSSSRNAEVVLQAAGLRDRFIAVVDGVVAAAESLPGKPAPDTFLRAAALLGASPARSVVFEDATSGVVAGRAGGFGLVVGVNRGTGAEALYEAGANLVVDDLQELVR